MIFLRPTSVTLLPYFISLISHYFIMF
uniref:Uncharacterized protein n=1 Tax=Heterorhabditis bacteriophora TaxID=37862 RepID=A0A1I7WVX7_HETBA